MTEDQLPHVTPNESSASPAPPDQNAPQTTDSTILRAEKKASLLLRLMKYTNAAAVSLLDPPFPTAQADPAIASSDPSLDYEIEIESFESQPWVISEPLIRFGLHVEDKNLIQSRWILKAERDVTWCSVFDMTVGLVVGWYMSSPRAVLEGGRKMPLISHWSDAVFMQWEMAREEYEKEEGVKAEGIRYILYDTVENEDTDKLVHEALKTFGTEGDMHSVLHAQEGLESAPTKVRQDSPIGYDSQASELNCIQRFKGESGIVYGYVTFAVESREGRLLLGSPHGACSAYLLAQHKDQFGHKYIDRVSVISLCIGASLSTLEDSVQNLNLLFHIKDVENEHKEGAES